MPLMSVYAAASGEKLDVTLSDALGYSGLGFLIVFVVLIVLMAFIAIMSLFFKKGGKKVEEASAPVEEYAKTVENAVKAAPVAPVAPVTEAPAVIPEGAMFVTLGGKRHTVSVVEKIPRFTVTVNGKSHRVDVESAEEVAE